MKDVRNTPAFRTREEDVDHFCLSLFSFLGFCRRLPEAVADFIARGRVDNDQQAAVVGYMERRRRYKFLDLRGSLGRRHMVLKVLDDPVTS